MTENTQNAAEERRRLLHELEVERNQLIRNIETCRIRDIDRQDAVAGQVQEQMPLVDAHEPNPGGRGRLIVGLAQLEGRQIED